MAPACHSACEISVMVGSRLSPVNRSRLVPKHDSRSANTAAASGSTLPRGQRTPASFPVAATRSISAGGSFCSRARKKKRSKCSSTLPLGGPLVRRSRVLLPGPSDATLAELAQSSEVIGPAVAQRHLEHHTAPRRRSVHRAPLNTSSDGVVGRLRLTLAIEEQVPPCPTRCGARLCY